MINQQKIALVTGSARRIGAEIAEHLHADGLNVVLHYHRAEKEAKELRDHLNLKRKNSAVALQADLMDQTSLEPLIEQAGNAWGQLDVLINNASRFFKTAVGKTTNASWDELLNTNLKAPFFLSQAAAPYLKAQQGCIINIACVHAERPMSDYPIYSISKAGLVMMTKALAKELGPDIRVNAISPGTIVPPEGENALSEELKQKIISRTALQRFGNAASIAKAVLFLVRHADYVTGQTLAIDGGRSLFI